MISKLPNWIKYAIALATGITGSEVADRVELPTLADTHTHQMCITESLDPKFDALERKLQDVLDKAIIPVDCS